MKNYSKGVVAGLAVVVLVLSGVLMGTQESVGAAAVYFFAVLLAILLTAVLVQAANGALVEELELRVRMLREHACCGCGHKLERHRDPKSADGFGCLDCQCQAVHRRDEGVVEPYLGRP